MSEAIQCKGCEAVSYNEFGLTSLYCGACYQAQAAALADVTRDRNEWHEMANKHLDTMVELQAELNGSQACVEEAHRVLSARVEEQAALKQQLADVTKERDRLDHEHDYDTKVTIPDLQQQLTSAQATIQRLEEERDDAQWFNRNYLKAIEKMGNKELELRERLATVEGLLKAVMEQWVNGRTVKDGISLTLRQMIEQALAPAPGDQPKRDNCQVCNGAKGGVPGNENIVDGVVMCDYCHEAQPGGEG